MHIYRVNSCGIFDDNDAARGVHKIIKIVVSFVIYESIVCHPVRCAYVCCKSNLPVKIIVGVINLH